MDRLSRRRLLRLGGVGLLAGGIAEGVTAADEPTSIVVSNVGFDSPANYEFTVSGELSSLPGGPGGDTIDGRSARGRVDTWKDGYEFTGEVTSFTHDGPVRVLVNGSEVDPATLGAGSGGTHRLVVSNVGFDESATYEVVTSGTVSLPGGQPTGDNASGNRGWGGVYGWKDAYDYTGEVTSFTHDGPVRTFVDGSEVDPASLGSAGAEWREIVVSNVGFDEPATYEFTVDEAVEASRSTPTGDSADGTRARGRVDTWKDGYRFRTRIESFESGGPVRVFVDGEEVDPATLGGGDESDGGAGGSDPRQRGTPLHDPDDWSAWGPYSQWADGTVAEDPTVAYRGERSLRVESSGGRLGASYRPDAAVDLSNARLSLATKWEYPNPGSPQLVTVYLYDSAGRRSDYAFTLPQGMIGPDEGWVRCPLYKKPPGNGRDDADLSSIDTVRLSSWPSGAARIWIDDVRVHEQPSRGRVAFTFDDGPASQWKAAEYMLDNGVPGTIFPIEGWIEGDRGLSLSELTTVKEAGWAVGAHPQRPDSLAAMSASEAAAAMDAEIEWLDAHGFDSNVVAWPYGAFDTDAIAAAEERFDLAFSTGGSPTAGEISTPYNVGRMGGSREDGDGNGIPDDPAYGIDRAAAEGSLLVLNYHSIDGDDRYTTPLDQFEATVDYALSKDVELVTATDLL